MVDALPLSRRRDERIEASLALRFRIGNGPEEPGETIDCTWEGVAVRCGAPPPPGCEITMTVGGLAPLRATVVRAWRDGFAARLMEPSPALLVLAEAEAAATAARGRGRS
ncbi:hypothetical protein [Amphiplicatus metriothermophilus]|uniref:PilZ domain-containing protein n=1 Tax=Amphiplicatus metriothermophilus TaxID=1519374 RepID=A0A239PTR0_9PROT|nr:hypothetical protein [Amphiplicatus metriothermophilus]MBB5519464.1 hypothetical protein [Amphiplicatus metriothermophilus]SNT73674.1 hypothetical protein SAMN06297382_1935 [Amphiplicatus metriothermophilus]